jgi:uncharacterized protein DUF5906
MSCRMFGEVEDQDVGYARVTPFSFSPFFAKTSTGASASALGSIKRSAFKLTTNITSMISKKMTAQATSQATCAIIPSMSQSESDVESIEKNVNKQIEEEPIIQQPEEPIIQEPEEEPIPQEPTEEPIPQEPEELIPQEPEEMVDDVSEEPIIHKKRKKHKVMACNDVPPIPHSSNTIRKKRKSKKHKTHQTIPESTDIPPENNIPDYFHPEHRSMFDIIDDDERKEIVQDQFNNDNDECDQKHNEEQEEEEEKKEVEAKNQVDDEDVDDQKVNRESDSKAKSAKKAQKQDLEETCKAIRETVLTKNTNPEMICNWFISAKRLFSSSFLIRSAYPLFGERNPQNTNTIFLHNVTTLKELNFELIKDILAEKHQISEIDFHNDMKELFRTWHSVFHASTILYASKHRVLTGTVIPIPQYVDHIPEEIEDILKPDQELMSFLYKSAEDKQLRRDDKNNVYEPFTTPEGDHTFYYKRKCTLQQFIENAFMPAAAFPREYDIYTDKSTTPRHVFSLISSLPDSRFPILKRNPNLFSFENGVLDIAGNEEHKTDPMTFYEYNDTGRKRNKSGYWKTVKDLPPDSISCNYIKGTVDRSWWPTIESAKNARLEKAAFKKKEGKSITKDHTDFINRFPVPEGDECISLEEFTCRVNQYTQNDNEEEIKIDAPPPLPRTRYHNNQSEKRHLRVEQKRLIKLLKSTPLWTIFETQNFEEEDTYWFGAIMGRMIAKTDKKEAAPYLRGVGGSGKSTILKLILAMLDPVDVTLIQDDGRKQFSDQHIVGKRIVAAMDIGAKPNFSKTRLNSYISKEPLLTDIMYSGESLAQMKPDANWMLGGNGEPPWTDLSGCIARRLIIFLFMIMIDKADTTLFDRCLAELPKLLIIFQFMYLDMINHLGARGFWDKEDGKNMMSGMMHKAKQSFLVSSSSLSSFLEDIDWIINPKNDKKNEITEANTITKTQFNSTYRKWRSNHHLQGDVKGINIIEDAPILKVFGISMIEDDQHGSFILSGVKLGNSAPHMI